MIKLPIPCLLLIGLFFACKATGQPNTFIAFRNYSQQDGLSSYNITKILQDRYGFLWIGTQDGVNCFDGKYFSVFNKESDSQHRLHGNNITDMALDSTRQLVWVATSLGGIAAINEQTHTVEYTITDNPSEPRFKGIWIHSLCISGDTLWIGAYGGLFAYNIPSGRFLTPVIGNFTPAELRTLDVSRLLRDHSGNIWAFCNGKGLLVFSAPSHRLFSLSQETFNFFHNSDDLHFWNVFDAGSSGIYAATNWGLRKIDCDSSRLRLSRTFDTSSFASQQLFACTVDNQGRVWFSNASSLLRWDPASRKTEKIADVNQATDSWQSTICALLTDRQGNIWAGSGEGLSFLSPAPKPFDKFSHSFFSSTRIQHAFTLHAVGDSIIYCGASNGLYKVNLVNRRIRKIDDASSWYMMESLDDRRVLASGSRGLFIIDGDQLTPASQRYPFLAPLSNDLLCASLRLNDSIFIFGSQSQKGLSVCDLKHKKLTCYNSGNSLLNLENDVINALFKDSRGRIWVLSINSIFQFDPLTGTCSAYHIQHPLTKEKMGIFFDMCETSGSFFIAAYGQGLIETDKEFHLKQVLSAKEGLANNGVYRVFPYHDSLVLVTSNNGLSIFNIHDRRLKTYYAADGLQSNSFEQFCGTTNAGLIYAGGIEGFTKIDPSLLPHRSTQPDLFISHVKIGLPEKVLDTTNLKLKELQIPAEALQTIVYFSLPGYTNHASADIQYRIKEISETWARLNDQDFINLIGLAPRTYTLEVRSKDQDGPWSGAKQIKLVFLPKWYQTLWFKISVLLVAVLLFFAFYRYRIHQLRQQHLIRQNISSDLHDDIGSILNSIKIFTHLAKKEPQQDTWLQQIELSITQAVVAIRDMIWVLDDDLDTIWQLLGRIRQFADPITSAREIRLTIDTDPDLHHKVLSKSEKRNLLLVAKESINNSIKYASCSVIVIRICSPEQKLVFEIEDDGSGFDTVASNTGNGLKNIRQRARQIKYSASITSTMGKGTKIRLRQL
jgi:signal transduction histidine kinase/ligand-binding sensor domain-containing protein